MRAIEFEAVSQQHTLAVPPDVPDGVRLRVLILMDEAAIPAGPSVSPAVKRQRPSPRLAGSVVMGDDLLESAVPPDDWEADI
jgi:hypothetical protein